MTSELSEDFGKLEKKMVKRIDKGVLPLHITAESLTAKRRRRRRFVSLFSIRNAVFAGVCLSMATALGGSFIETRDLARTAAEHAARNEAERKSGIESITEQLRRMEDNNAVNFRLLLDRIDRVTAVHPSQK